MRAAMRAWARVAEYMEQMHQSGVSPFSTRSIGLSTLTGGLEASSGVTRSTWVKGIGILPSFTARVRHRRRVAGDARVIVPRVFKSG